MTQSSQALFGKIVLYSDNVLIQIKYSLSHFMKHDLQTQFLTPHVNVVHITDLHCKIRTHDIRTQMYISYCTLTYFSKFQNYS